MSTAVPKSCRWRKSLTPQSWPRTGSGPFEGGGGQSGRRIHPLWKVRHRDTSFCSGLRCSRVVKAVGDGVTRVVVDDRVYVAGTLTGAYAEKTLCEESQVHFIPKRISYKQGASVGIPYTAAYRALFQRGGAKAGETVLIHGATGGVGMATLQ
jgi:NADPH:quinone reductase-like Zn-dependent oxidoreductase